MAEQQSKETITSDVEVEVTITKPRRVLHFSDGVEEEIDEIEAPELQATKREKTPVDPKTLSWGPWLSHYAWTSGGKVINTIDYVGEGLANFFGITTPKYQLEIDEHERLQEEQRRAQEDERGWVHPSDGDIPLVTNPPSKVLVSDKV